MNRTWSKCCAALIAAAAALAVHSAAAGDIIGDWDSVKLPPKPELKAVTVDPKTTALLVLDLMKNNCGARPRRDCAQRQEADRYATLPQHDDRLQPHRRGEARGHG